MVEQNARAALAIAHRGYVLATGRNRFTDTAAALLANREVAEAFLGGAGMMAASARARSSRPSSSHRGRGRGSG